MRQIVGATITPHHRAAARPEAGRRGRGDGHDTGLLGEGRQAA